MEHTELNFPDELLIKYLTGSASSEERTEALRWIHESKSNQLYFDQLRDIYETTKITQPSSTYDADISWEKVKAMYYKRRSIIATESRNTKQLFYLKETLKYAAIILAIATVGMLTYFMVGNRNEGNQSVWTSVEAPLGAKSLVTLPDGSKVWLNAGSKIKYPGTFGKKKREVFLEGEAYFDVSKSKNSMFIVRTGYININVLGTEFNVKAYAEENTIQTTLVKGIITVTGEKSKITGIDHEIYLKPNQSITFIKNKEHVVKTNLKIKKEVSRNKENVENLVFLPKIDPVVYTSWKDDRWKIQSESLSDLAIKLERKYNVKFKFNDESLKAYKFTGILRDETLEQMLNVIKLSAPIDYSIKENTVFLNENQSFKEGYDELLMKQNK